MVGLLRILLKNTLRAVYMLARTNCETRGCRLLAQLDLHDGRIVEVYVSARDVNSRSQGSFLKKKRVEDFISDACATLALAYHRASEVYGAAEKSKTRNSPPRKYRRARVAPNAVT
jgi:hypothetical protein